MRLFLRVLVNLFLLFTGPFSLADEVLPVNQVFIPKVSSVSQDYIDIDIDIKPKYYLYRQRLFELSGDDIAIEGKTLSPGSTKTDSFFGEQSIWYGGKNQAKIRIKYQNVNKATKATIKLKYQGCEENAICYPPETVFLPIDLPTAKKPFVDILNNNKKSDLFFTQKKKNIPLVEDKAFPFYITPIDKNTLSLSWQIAKGYYLYRDKIKIVGKNIANIQLSQGINYHDQFFGEQQIYRDDNATAIIYFIKYKPNKQIDIQFQGCSDFGICYPVMSRRVEIDNNRIQSITVIDNHEFPIDKIYKKPTKTVSFTLQEGSKNAIDRFSKTLEKQIWIGFGLLFLAGLALSFTPCVLPMLPILLGIITKQKQVTRLRGAVLSSAYALGVAVMMAIFGLVIAKTGINIQIIFQKPLWLIAFAAIFIAMGLAMLGVFNLAVSSRVQNKVYALQNRFNEAKPSNLFVAGALSTLVAGPCIAPPLIAVLTFISTTNNSFLGAFYLFALGLGMSTPLVVFATLSTTIPKTGGLSKLVTKVFAMLMFGVGLWVLTRLITGAISMMLWGMFMVVVAWIFWKNSFIKKYAKLISQALAMFFLTVGLTWFAGGAMGNSNPFRPFMKKIEQPFIYVDNHKQLKEIINNSAKPVMLDLYADWCVSCQELEHITFADPSVIKAFKGFTLVKLDITDMNPKHREMLAELELVGPPALLFFKRGEEALNQRQIGFINAKNLMEKLKQIKNPLVLVRQPKF